MTGTRTRITRLLVAVVFALPVLLSALSLSSLAAPSEEEVQAAKDKLAGLEHDFEVLAEQYNDAKYRLALIERKLAEARDQSEAAERDAQTAEGRLAKRAVQAYVGTGSQVDGLLGAENIAEFSDRLEFMGAVAEADAEIARAASNARQEADWAADRFADARIERQREVAAIESHLDRLDSMIDEQASLYEQLHQDRADYLAVLAAQRAALEQARQEAAQDTPPADTTSDTGGYVPPVNGWPRGPRSQRRGASKAPSTSSDPPTRTSASTAPASPRGPGRRRACTSRTLPPRSTPRSRTCRSGACSRAT